MWRVNEGCSQDIVCLKGFKFEAVGVWNGPRNSRRCGFAALDTGVDWGARAGPSARQGGASYFHTYLLDSGLPRPVRQLDDAWVSVPLTSPRRRPTGITGKWFPPYCSPALRNRFTTRPTSPAQQDNQEGNQQDNPRKPQN